MQATKDSPVTNITRSPSVLDSYF